MVRVGAPGFFDEADEVHISIAFTWDLGSGEGQSDWLERQWRHVAPIKMGGPAFGEPSGDFLRGFYLRDGYTITSRGCPNHCPYCFVPVRERGLRELPIVEGWCVQDDNLLACSREHIESVLTMAGAQQRQAVFSGGLEARLLEQWHVDRLRAMNPEQMFFAYDRPGDLEPLEWAATMLKAVGFTRHHMRCYVLAGYRDDTPDKAEERLRAVLGLGFHPCIMLYRGEDGEKPEGFEALERYWSRPALIYRGEGM